MGVKQLPDIPEAAEFTSLKAGDSIVETAQMSLGNRVLMFGKVSGVTIRTVSAIDTEIQWKDMNGAKTREHTITGDTGHMAFFGDSGA